MKILNAICFQNIGGVDRVFRDYCEVLKDKGHDVALLISDNGIDDYNAKKIFKLKNIAPLCDFFHLLWIVLTFRPDVIICHSGRVMKLMRFLKFLPCIKTFGINHGTTFKHSMNCDYAISVNAQINNNLIAAGFDASRAFVVQNGVRIDQKYRAKEIKKNPVIGIYGRIEFDKGFDILIKAAAELKKQNFDFRLKIGGFEIPGDRTLANIKNLAAEEKILDKCDFVGVVKDKPNFFSDVDILCVPSRHESFGMVILEGFLFSTLVISSTTNGGKFLIKDGENGLLFDNENYLDLAEKIKYILQNPHLSEALTQKAFLRLEKEFSFDSLGDEIDKMLKYAIQN
jgi:glycosyltransferase involved in cell wall biosynthesis